MYEKCMKLFANKVMLVREFENIYNEIDIKKGEKKDETHICS